MDEILEYFNLGLTNESNISVICQSRRKLKKLERLTTWPFPSCPPKEHGIRQEEAVA